MARKKILIVDDELDFSRILGAHLKAHGYNIAWATDAVGAITMAQQERPDFIILDISMPAGDGFTVMERLAKSSHTALIPIIVVTGKVLSGKQRALSEGAVAFFTKPVDYDRLLGIIGNLLGQPVDTNEQWPGKSEYSSPKTYNLDK